MYNKKSTKYQQFGKQYLVKIREEYGDFPIQRFRSEVKSIFITYQIF